MITSRWEDVIGEQGRDVVLVVHSYGGISGSAAAGPFVRSVRGKQGKDGSVVAILFMTSLAIPKDTFYAAGDRGEACVVCDGEFA